MQIDVVQTEVVGENSKNYVEILNQVTVLSK